MGDAWSGRARWASRFRPPGRGLWGWSRTRFPWAPSPALTEPGNRHYAEIALQNKGLGRCRRSLSPGTDRRIRSTAPLVGQAKSLFGLPNLRGDAPPLRGPGARANNRVAATTLARGQARADAVVEPRAKVLGANHIGRPALPLRNETLEPLGVEPAVLGGAIAREPYASLREDRVRLGSADSAEDATPGSSCGASPDRGREFLLVVPQQIGVERH